MNKNLLFSYYSIAAQDFVEETKTVVTRKRSRQQLLEIPDYDAIEVVKEIVEVTETVEKTVTKKRLLPKTTRIKKIPLLSVMCLPMWSLQSKVLRTRSSTFKEKLLVRLLKVLKIKSLVCLPF